METNNPQPKNKDQSPQKSKEEGEQLKMLDEELDLKKYQNLLISQSEAEELPQEHNLKEDSDYSADLKLISEQLKRHLESIKEMKKRFDMRFKEIKRKED